MAWTSPLRTVIVNTTFQRLSLLWGVTWSSSRSFSFAWPFLRRALADLWGCCVCWRGVSPALGSNCPGKPEFWFQPEFRWTMQDDKSTYLLASATTTFALGVSWALYRTTRKAPPIPFFKSNQITTNFSPVFHAAKALVRSTLTQLIDRW